MKTKMVILPMRRDDDETSRHEVAEEDLRMRQQYVLQVARKLKEFTHEELVDNYFLLGLPAQSISGIRTRCKELERAGLVEKTEMKKRNRAGSLVRIHRVI